jgi:hypothetical protein
MPLARVTGSLQARGLRLREGMQHEASASSPFAPCGTGSGGRDVMVRELFASGVGSKRAAQV